MIDVRHIAELQVQWTKDWHVKDRDPVGLKGVDVFILGNHRCNFNLWHEEDRARRDDMGFEYVCAAKRAIDGYNQRRNDYIERIDQVLFEVLDPQPDEHPLNSETPGMIVDRLSIMALKIFHMEEQTLRDDVSAEHKQQCVEKLGVLKMQRADLVGILETLIQDIQAGRRAYKVYFQFKMYNDPSLNPELY